MKKSKLCRLTALTAALFITVSNMSLNVNAESLDLEQYIREYMRSKTGQPMHMTDPTGWYAKDITKVPVYDDGESVVILYSDAAAPESLTGEIYVAAFYSEVELQFDAQAVEAGSETLSALDTLLGSFADTNNAVSYRHFDGNPIAAVTDHSLQADFPDKVMGLFQENPDLLAAVEIIRYRPVRCLSYEPDFSGGVKFELTDAQNQELRAMIEEEHLPWTLTDNDAVTCDSAEEVKNILTTVSARFGTAVLRKAPEGGEQGIGGMDSPQILYQKKCPGDADGDGSVTLKDATAAMKQYNQTEILGEDGFMSAQQIENADLDGDGAVTAKDATYIQKYVNFNVVLEEPKTWEEIISPKNA